MREGASPATAGSRRGGTVSGRRQRIISVTDFGGIIAGLGSNPLVGGGQALQDAPLLVLVDLHGATPHGVQGAELVLQALLLSPARL